MVLNCKTPGSSTSTRTSSNSHMGSKSAGAFAADVASNGVTTATATAAKSKFSFDKFFFGGKRSKQKKLANQCERTGTHSSSSFFSKKSSHEASALLAANATSSTAKYPSLPRDNSKTSYRPPPIMTSEALKKMQASSSSAANVRLCQSPGGRGNMQLAIPITPPSVTNKKSKHKHHSPVADEGLRASGIYGRFSSASGGKNALAAFSLGPWRESASSHSSRELLGSLRESTVQDFLASLPRDLAVDVTTICTPSSISLARKHIARVLQFHVFEIRSTKWAAYFLQIVKRARTMRQLSSGDAVSLRWVICAYVQQEVRTRRRKKEALDQQMQKKMTDYRVALQCIGGTTVLKYGRKGKPHQTQLVIENGEYFRWTSKLLSHATTIKKKKSIPLASVIAIRAGPTTEVLTRALHKGTLALQDAKCTMSLITATRTFDIKAKSAAEREWLHKSFAFLVELAHEHEKRVAQQVELSIMKRMETLNVWKHGRKGRPHKTRIFINRFGEISWQGRSNDSIQLDEIVAIDLGHRTQVFSRSLASGFATSRVSSRCFSLVTRTRTLDIETDSEHMRDWFVVAFRYLMDKVQEKTAALKREKAEKQLKLLQELCGGIGIANISPPSPAAGLPAAVHA
ncbi:hypothetical protein Gpo141_00001148 [Globisporangium polare]